MLMGLTALHLGWFASVLLHYFMSLVTFGRTWSTEHKEGAVLLAASVAPEFGLLYPG